MPAFFISISGFFFLKKPFGQKNHNFGKRGAGPSMATLRDLFAPVFFQINCHTASFASGTCSKSQPRPQSPGIPRVPEIYRLPSREDHALVGK
jgi:hypothetical protein